MPLNTIVSEKDLKESSSSKAVLLFGADWHEACPMLEMVLGALALQHAGSGENVQDGAILFGKVDAESATELSDKYEVTMVPTILLLLSNSSNNGDYTISERLEGESLADPSTLTLAVQRLVKTQVGATTEEETAAAIASGTINTTSNAKDALNARLSKLVRMDTVVLFMKGTPDKPRCGFSRQVVELLEEQKVLTYASFDILEDQEVRQGLKEYSDWPTYPQIYVRGELMGGLDIMKETVAEGSLLEDWEIADMVGENSTTTKESLNDRLDKLIRRHPIMLFMKGLPSNPKCGFSRQIVEILDGDDSDSNGLSYDSFDILSDDEVRQGLKEYSDWPTFPQLYVNGELIGGLDIVKELQESGELEAVLNEEQ
uniref:Glutaredoxin n=2 Tax=Pseudo-nitzschia australis TaxID=44445 RepID=A0A7S4ENV0_9STRA|mmetsp:Transcript_17142/g.37491  ORF Transcript_17142/g.37491 Transcript_17142/m.37491 type:complete len:372 (+) Transcript_17142:139-1254(+)|eukprot:CAMPEP_0168182390 /NCGR_PEP_ID=MMETSP0139_2-20121125/11869_1 /TAXON_ID=44445 /ORGANISM="Pseudo-nitzschia australis, Strain 10249 10 AB" /LENGTH=371 /DNA_ID=CAMNT_0008103319 /DNA_START=131 /DNA_END=1246 /DNA_ORIENTATION=-